jgi:hypothetical protein
MKKVLCVVIGLFLTLSSGLAYSQEREPETAPRPQQFRPPMPMPGGPMGGGMGPGVMAMMLGLLRDNPKLAGIRYDDADAWRNDADSWGGNEQDG